MGIRFSTTIFSGRISCELARELSITKIFSSFSKSIAGSLSGKFNGIALCFCFSFYRPTKLIIQNGLRETGTCLFYILSLFSFSLLLLPLFGENQQKPMPISYGNLPVLRTKSPVKSVCRHIVSEFVPGSLLPVQPPASISFPNSLRARYE